MVRVRDLAAARLTRALPQQTHDIERLLVGRGATEADKERRIRFIPLPSIGTEHADHSVRRLLVEVPPDCPLGAEHIGWALSGLQLSDDMADDATGEVTAQGPQLQLADDMGMLRHYGVARPARVWRTVTPALLPRTSYRGKLTGQERLAREGEIAKAAQQALRHAGLDVRDAEIRCIQREPFEARGRRADAILQESSLPAHLRGRQPHHLEIAFSTPMYGPLMVGDGRFVGLGLMAPVRDTNRDAFVFLIESKPRPPTS